MSEKRFWEYLRDNMDWKARRLECGDPGIADIYYKVKRDDKWLPGWIELKYLKDYPKNRELKVKIKHFTKFQKLFLRQEGETLGRSWLFIKIKRNYFLLPWTRAMRLETFSYLDLFKISYHWANRIDFKELERTLYLTHREEEDED